jgi:hypothetical protein
MMSGDMLEPSLDTTITLTAPMAFDRLCQDW